MDNGEPGPVEMKNVFGGYFDDEGNWREPSNFSDTWKIGEAPLPYQWQLHTQMACMGASRGEIAALIGSTEFTVISYDFNPEAFEMVIPTLYEFWLCVKNDTPPEIDGSEATERALRKLHPFDNGETTELSDEIAYTINEWRELQNIESETKESIREKKNKIIAALERNTYGAVNGNRVVSFKMNKAGNRVLRKVGK
jgi:predicted phage-related endonuclease